MEILIIRHADPDYSIDSLTPQGWKEAELLAEKLKQMDIAAFYCSPKGRARDTAKPTLEKMNRTMEIKPWLREFKSPIVFEDGTEQKRCWDLLPSYWKMRPEFFDREKWKENPVMASSGVVAEYERVAEEFDKLIAEHGYIHEGEHFRVVRENHDRIVLFCHYGVSCVLLAHILGMSPVILWQNFVMLPSSVTSVITEEREQGIATFRMKSYGDTGHLFAGGEEPSFAARFCECFSDDTRHDA